MPKDLATRISYFYCASALSGAFSGLLAAGIAQMNGVGGFEGWRWIFILEGLATIVLGCACFFLLIDTPALSKRWLEPDEIRYLEISMFIKQGGKFHEESGVKMRDLKMVLTNWRVYVQAYFLMCQSALSYGKRFFPMRRKRDTDQLQASNSPFLPLPRLWASAPQWLNSPRRLHTLLLPPQLSCSLDCRIASTGECLSSLFR